MSAGPDLIAFGHEGETVVILAGDIVLGPEDQYPFTLRLFEAILAAQRARVARLNQVPF
jgi:hypothetical protein